MNKSELVGACGLYCGACGRYQSFVKGKKFSLSLEEFSGQSHEDIICKGCHSDTLSDHCLKCKIRLCALDKGYDHCGLCKNFPCDKSIEMYSRSNKYGAIHCETTIKNIKKINKIGSNKWLLEQDELWKCSCGESISWYSEICQKCGKKIDKLVKRK